MPKIKWILAVSLVILGVITWVTWPSGKLRVVFCNVGQGDGILITQNNFQLVIDSGPNNRMMLGCLGKYIPFWDKEIEVVVISHWDRDHSGGLQGLRDNYKINKLYSSTFPAEVSVQKIYSDNLAINDVVRYGEFNYAILNPNEDWGNENDNSIVGVLSYKDKRILLMGDATIQVEQKLVWRKILNGKMDVLKVSHHGSAQATSQELLTAIQPAEAVISVGKNSFGHPTRAVLDRLTMAGVRIRRTDEEGDVVLEL